MALIVHEISALRYNVIYVASAKNPSHLHAVFCVVLRVAAADEVPLPSEEVPATLFASIPEEDIDLYVSGTWQAEVSAGFALTWSTLSPVMQTTTISDIDSGFRFDQYPDIIISLWIRDRWFFDLSFKEGNDVNSIVAGYQGKEGELVQEVRVGNIDIGSFESSFFTLPEAGIDSLGLWARLTPEHSEHSFALRYDPAAYQRVTFRGMNEVKQEQFDLDDYSTNRVFVLPDDDVEDVVLYIQDEDGAFQEAGTDDAVVDTENGIVYLKEAPTGRVAVYYKKGGKEVGDSGLGTDALCGINADGLFDPKATPVDFSLIPGPLTHITASIVLTFPMSLKPLSTVIRPYSSTAPASGPPFSTAASTNCPRPHRRMNSMRPS